MVDLMEALRKSLDAVSAAKKPSAKAGPEEEGAPLKAEPKRKRA